MDGGCISHANSTPAAGFAHEQHWRISSKLSFWFLVCDCLQINLLNQREEQGKFFFSLGRRDFSATATHAGY